MDMPPGEHMKPPFRQRLAVLSRRLADRAAEFEESARYGAPALPFRSAWAVLSAAAIYGAIGRKVADGGEHAWDRRVTTSATEKLRFILRGYVEARGRAARYPATPRVETLWTRPRG
jgi:phytoene synthase